MRTITIQNDVPLTDEATGEPLDSKGNVCKPHEQDSIRFADFFLKVLLGDPRWGADVEILTMRIDIAGRFIDARQKKRATFDLTEAEHAKLCEFTRKPSAPYSPAWAARVPQFFRAVLDAPLAQTEEQKQ